jgi:hypothetical protein
LAGGFRKLLWGIAVVAFFIGIGGALVRGFWGVSQDCHAWVTSHGYQLVQNNWWAKDRGCVARTPGGDEILHSEDLGNKTVGWVWQFVIFAVGSLPAMGMVVFVSMYPRGTDAAGS